MKPKIPPALRHSRYLDLWLGLLISIAGSQMQIAALHWHIRTLTGKPDPLALGGIGLARILPVIVFSFLGGPVADTFNRRRILFVTQSVMALTALALAYLTHAGQITIWSIYLLTALQAAVVAFDGPARQAMIPNLVPANDLPSAFSMSSIAMNTGSMLSHKFPNCAVRALPC
ncbi:MAG: MFS transporter [Candidatus Villigracilaceae bacterium]